MTSYKNQITNLIGWCNDYMSGKIDSQNLSSLIYSTASTISSIEEKDLIRSMKKMSADLELGRLHVSEREEVEEFKLFLVSQIT